MAEKTEARGLLIIGDVHLASLRPERRKDNYAAAVLDKISQALTIARTEKLIPVFLGDMFHRHVERSEEIKTELTELLADSWAVPLCNTGNHDMGGEVLQKSDSLAWYAASKLIKVCTVSGPMGEYSLDGIKVGVGMTPYGQHIPDDVGECFPQADGVIWFTHHDLAFEGAYPGALPLKTISGCGIAVNGHMHLLKPPVIGETTWCNFGSLSRTATDAADHVPAVTEFRPSGDSMETMFISRPLRYERDVFDMTGRLVPPMPSANGTFAAMAMEELTADAARTDSGSIFADELREFLREGCSPAVHPVVISLCERATGNLN